MNFSSVLANELKQLIGFSSAQPKTINLTDADGLEVAIDFTAVDSMSCSLHELRLHVPSLIGTELAALKTWAENLSSRVTYLLESIGPLEFDPDQQQVLIRSTPPDKQENQIKFYEILLQSGSDGNFSLSRYSSESGTPGRTRVDIQVTHEVLDKLVDDLIATIPS